MRQRRIIVWSMLLSRALPVHPGGKKGRRRSYMTVPRLQTPILKRLAVKRHGGRRGC
jgi:hypothetical protein